MDDRRLASSLAVQPALWCVDIRTVASGRHWRGKPSRLCPRDRRLALLESDSRRLPAGSVVLLSVARKTPYLYLVRGFVGNDKAPQMVGIDWLSQVTIE